MMDAGYAGYAAKIEDRQALGEVIQTRNSSIWPRYAFIKSSIILNVIKC